MTNVFPIFTLAISRIKCQRDSANDRRCKMHPTRPLQYPVMQLRTPSASERCGHYKRAPTCPW